MYRLFLFPIEFSFQTYVTQYRMINDEVAMEKVLMEICIMVFNKGQNYMFCVDLYFYNFIVIVEIESIL